MKASPSIIIVESPLQVLCAYEYIHSFGVEYKLIVRKNDHDLNNQQVDKLLQILNLDVYKTIMIPKYKSFTDKIRIACFLGGFIFTPKTTILIGDYMGLLRYLPRYITKHHYILLDDGIGSIEIQRQLVAQDKEIDLFTLFNIEPYKNQVIYKNSFDYLVKNNINSISNLKQIDLFIGTSKYVDLGIMTSEDYFEVVSTVAKKYENLIYVPHRGSDQETLNLIKNIPNVTILKLDVCIEMYLLMENIYPKTVHSILSSALFSLSIMYKNSNFFTYKVKVHKTKENFQDSVEYLYDEYKKHSNISLIDLKQDNTIENRD